MKVVINIEANGLKPDKIWVCVCKDITTGEYHIFRNITEDQDEQLRFRGLLDCCVCLIGHNALGYDLPVLDRLLTGLDLCRSQILDTFIISKLVDYPREGHSAEDYGMEFGMGFVKQVDYSRYSKELEEYCIRKVDISHKIYNKYKKYIDNVDHSKSISLEHTFQSLLNDMSNYGFTLDTKRTYRYLKDVTDTLQELDKDIQDAFQPRLKLIREVTPKATKYGTISLSSIPKSLRDSVADMHVDAPYSYCHWVDFNPGSPKQVVELLNEAGWRPEDKTNGHIDTEREYNKLSRSRNKPPEVALTLETLYSKLNQLRITGWKVNEANLSTLPRSAPTAAKLLAKRILYESRRKTLVEWTSLVEPDGRIHGEFHGIGAWTHRMAHRRPNMANVTNEYDTNGKVRLLGKELRQCWTVPRDRLLVGVDAEGIQLRIFAHYINDPAFIDALVRGKKDDGTDPHSLNQQIIGSCCKSRDAAKRFIFAFLLGGGIGKLSEILGVEQSEGTQALERVYRRYTGLQTLKDTIIPTDARRGYFVGVDGRKVRILGETEGERRHRAMSGYLQNGEVVVVKTAATIFGPKLRDFDSHLVDIIHDEYQIETPNDFGIAKQVAEIVDNSIRQAGLQLSLRCPLAGSYYNDKKKEYTIGRNWWETH